MVLVQLDEGMVPGILPVGPTYILKIWEKDNPSVMATFTFDLVPAPSE